jgi:hypothetical protein
MDVRKGIILSKYVLLKWHLKGVFFYSHIFNLNHLLLVQHKKCNPHNLYIPSFILQDRFFHILSKWDNQSINHRAYFEVR